jgi:ubiquinone/menaquinone biosynthesis C-methylase UbiE
MKNVTQATYDKIAPEFARVNATMPENMLAEAQRYIEIVPRPGLYLDLGCGTGRDLAWFEQHDLNLFGADLSAGMLDQARQVTSRPLAQMDMLNLGFADQAFTGVWCNAALLHLPKALAPQALQEMWRVLRPGGILNIAIQAGAGEQFEVNPYEAGLGERFFARYQMDEMTHLLTAQGFIVLETEKVFAHKEWLRFLTRRTN